MTIKQLEASAGAKAVAAILQELAAVSWPSADVLAQAGERWGGPGLRKVDGIAEYVDCRGGSHFAFDVRHIYCAVVNHPAAKDAKDKDVLRLKPLFLYSPWGSSKPKNDTRTKKYRTNTGLWLPGDDLDGIDAFDEQFDGKARVVRNLRKVIEHCLSIAPQMGETGAVTIPMRAQVSLVKRDGMYDLEYECDAVFGYEYQAFFWRLWRTIVQYSSESMKACRKCGRFFVAPSVKAIFCSRACAEADKRVRYAQLPDRAEDQAISMMAVNYRRRYEGRTPSKQYALKWLEAYRQKRQAKGNSVSTRPVEMVQAKL